jgi:hypothetical protein
VISIGAARLIGAGLMATARGLRLCGSQDEPPVSQPAPAVGRFNQARQEAAFGHQQASDSGCAATICSLLSPKTKEPGDANNHRTHRTHGTAALLFPCVPCVPWWTPSFSVCSVVAPKTQAMRGELPSQLQTTCSVCLLARPSLKLGEERRACPRVSLDSA